MPKKLKIISAGAGSGKTYRLTSEMVELLKGGVRASGIIATTFTKKAAAELQERVRVRLLETGLTEQADELTNALIGTVHGLGVKLLRRFAFEAGVSPEVDIIADEDQQVMFNKSLATVLTIERMQAMDEYSNRLGLNKKGPYDWRTKVKQLTDVARSNDFSIEVLEQSKKKSFETFKVFLGKKSDRDPEEYKINLMAKMEEAITRLEDNEDETKVTRGGIETLKSLLNELKFRGNLDWHKWVKISKLKVGAKSKDDVEELKEVARSHDTHPQFHQDIENFIDQIFDIAIEAIQEYESYKKQRGLIDYIDMEIQVKRLLDNPHVKEVLESELDLLMVDEFQDTSPIQLEIFLKLSDIAKHSVWVGDPKQSIYGFRGADPKLMQAIIDKVGGVKPEDIQEYSWRSREDIVFATNAIFTKAFLQIPESQVVLKPKRLKVATADSKNDNSEPIEVGEAIHHWHFDADVEGNRLPGSPWMENSIATAVKRMLEKAPLVHPKDAEDWRALQPGDIAVLCRSNRDCQKIADALHQAGLKAAIARTGLLHTAESKLILACLKYMLNKHDSLSIAEILKLASGKHIEEIIENRLTFLENIETSNKRWAEDDIYIEKLNELRRETLELSSAELLDVVLEELDLRRIIAQWGKVEQRLDNVDVMRRFALQYEAACNRLHTAASLGGFLLWFNDLGGQEKDTQGSGEGADAVNVLTYHRSKGLEWPMVICHSLEGKLRSDVFGMHIVAESDSIDLKNILANRWLRFWINPYSDQSGGTTLTERLEASDVSKVAKEQALQEEARLLYVGVTRARDYLVFPTRKKQTLWLNRVWHEGDEKTPSLDENSGETQWEWGNILYKDTWLQSFPKDFTHTELEAEQVLFLEKRKGNQKHPSYHIDLSKESFQEKITSKAGAKIEYGSTFQIHENTDSYALGKMLNSFLVADHMTYDSKERWNMAEGFLERYELGEEVNVNALLEISTKFFQYVDDNFSVKNIYRKYPIRHFYEKRLFETEIDFVIETEQGLVIIQNSNFAGDAKKIKNETLQQASWLALSKAALQVIFQKEKIRGFIHYPLNGIMMGIETQIKTTVNV